MLKNLFERHSLQGMNDIHYGRSLRGLNSCLRILRGSQRLKTEGVKSDTTRSARGLGFCIVVQFLCHGKGAATRRAACAIQPSARVQRHGPVRIATRRATLRCECGLGVACSWPGRNACATWALGVRIVYSTQF